MRTGRQLPGEPEPGMNQSTARPRIGLKKYLPFESFATSDQVLLCHFGLDPDASRSSGQLRNALVAAGFGAPVARHLVRSSPLLRRAPNGQYLLRELDGSIESRGVVEVRWPRWLGWW
jgi:hypothetical protein